MMNDIGVLIYSYKGKQVKETIDSIINNLSNKYNIEITLIDQNPINRKEQFSKFFKINYVHIFWDLQLSPCKHKSDFIKFSNSKYNLILGDSIIFSKNWDEILINFIKEKNIIISGNTFKKISNENLFYIKKDNLSIDNFTLTNFIDRDFIFGSKENLNKVKYPYYLKYNGEEEAFSIELFSKLINIYACPTELYSNISNKNLEVLYSPFSINHNYNEVIDLIKYGKNKYSELLNNNIKNFSNFHNFDFNKLNKLPFNTNDVEYNPEKLNFNKVDARKFVARTKAIH